MFRMVFRGKGQTYFYNLINPLGLYAFFTWCHNSICSIFSDPLFLRTYFFILSRSIHGLEPKNVWLSRILQNLTNGRVQTLFPRNRRIRNLELRANQLVDFPFWLFFFAILDFGDSVGRKFESIQVDGPLMLRSNMLILRPLYPGR